MLYPSQHLHLSEQHQFDGMLNSFDLQPKEITMERHVPVHPLPEEIQK
ncbi:hypothetical protein scyTo_0013405, partial [Scyliorhinus torazame]|nr:hypothetical protein [Scyliorhinus torazame]